MALISSYEWPGNVRELENAIERALVFSEGNTIEAEHLPPTLRAATATAPGPCIPGATLKEIERHAILTTLESTGGSTSKTAQILGVSVRMVQYRIQQYVAAPQSRAPALKKAGAGTSKGGELVPFMRTFVRPIAKASEPERIEDNLGGVD